MNTFLVVFLGNHPDEYKHTRHNAGFIVCDDIFGEDEYATNPLPKYLYKKILSENGDIFVCKPHTLMNNSGQAVKHIAQKHQIPTDNIIVVHDDIDINLGNIKIAYNRGDANHNGVKSINSSLGTKKYTRIRIGIGPKPKEIPLNNFVMGRFSEAELEKVHSISQTVQQIIETIIKDGITFAFNKYNKR